MVEFGPMPHFGVFDRWMTGLNPFVIEVVFSLTINLAPIVPSAVGF